MNKKFWWLLVPSCLIIFTLICQSFNKNSEKTLKIGMLQFVEHEALDASVWVKRIFLCLGNQRFLRLLEIPGFQIL